MSLSLFLVRFDRVAVAFLVYVPILKIENSTGTTAVRVSSFCSPGGSILLSVRPSVESTSVGFWGYFDIPPTRYGNYLARRAVCDVCSVVFHTYTYMYTSASSTPRACPYRFGILERNKLCAHKLRDKDIRRKICNVRRTQIPKAEHEHASKPDYFLFKICQLFVRSTGMNGRYRTFLFVGRQQEQKKKKGSSPGILYVEPVKPRVPKATRCLSALP